MWSRISYILIFLLSYYPLKKILAKNKPDFIIIHLITSLPILMSLFNDFQTKLILRISGFPKLNFLRKMFWKLSIKKINCITSPTEALIDQLTSLDIFEKNKLYFLPDAILNINDLYKNYQSKEIFKNEKIQKNYYMAAGRLTKQKNFSYLIKEFKKFLDIYPEEKLIIFGEGEERRKLLKIINKQNISNSVFLMGYSSNIHLHMKNAQSFILSSLWEDPGFVLIEAAYSNLFIISSDCKNGPKEFLKDGKGGLLFKNNQENALMEKLLYQKEMSEHDKNKMRVISKKNSKKYSLFQHYLKLHKLFS